MMDFTGETMTGSIAIGEELSQFSKRNKKLLLTQKRIQLSQLNKM